MPWWLSGLLIDGVYRATAWVVSVMLPPMTIFFPLFTLLEDFGYLPRVAFNLDGLFKRVGAQGKQALTMCMGLGCNAAGVVATRVIESPRERLIAIITNNFSLCNGRWPTQILLSTIFFGAIVPTYLRGVAAALAVVCVALLGVLLTFVTSWGLSRTVLRGEPSSFHLELPPYRPPRLLQTLYTSLIDRTIFVLWRAIIFAMPAGAVIWLISNVSLGGQTLAAHAVQWLDPLGALIGLNGVILLAYVIAIPANEIVIPTVLMLTVLTTGLAGVGAGPGVMFDVDSTTTAQVLRSGGWTLLTAVNLMLFSLMHNPCSTTIYTIWKETAQSQVDGAVDHSAFVYGNGNLFCPHSSLAVVGWLNRWTSCLLGMCHMKPIVWTMQLLVFGLLSNASHHALAQVRAWEGSVTIPTYPWQEDLNPPFWALGGRTSCRRRFGRTSPIPTSCRITCRANASTDRTRRSSWKMST